MNPITTKEDEKDHAEHVACMKMQDIHTTHYIRLLEKREIEYGFELYEWTFRVKNINKKKK